MKTALPRRAAVLVLACALLPPTAAMARRAGTPLLTERFTEATADARFQGYGSACLTGAARVPVVPIGDHPLHGCPTVQNGPVPPGSGAPYGYLQLTDASHDQAGAVLFDTPLPAADGLDITFEQWQYGSTTPSPIGPGMQHADGISFFLTDGTAELTAPGAFGGSLGYAQKRPDDNPALPIIHGVNKGYLGIGLDVLGNYFGDWEQRGHGCTTRSPSGTAFYIPAPGQNMVTVRGPGNGDTGYCWLDATTSNKTTTGPWPSTLPGQLVGTLQTMPPNVTPQQAQMLLEPSKRTVHVVVTPGPNPHVTVSIDFQNGAGMQQVLDFDAPGPVPDTYKFGFGASTGLFTDVHLIRNVVISTFRPMAKISLRKSVVKPVPGKAGETLHYRFVVTNTGDQALNTIAIADSIASGLTCPPGTLQPGASVTCTGEYVLTAQDVARGKVTNTATATGRRTDNEMEVVSEPDSVTVHLPKIPPPPTPKPPHKHRHHHHKHHHPGEKRPLPPRDACRGAEREC